MDYFHLLFYIILSINFVSARPKTAELAGLVGQDAKSQMTNTSADPTPVLATIMSLPAVEEAPSYNSGLTMRRNVAKEDPKWEHSGVITHHKVSMQPESHQQNKLLPTTEKYHHTSTARLTTSKPLTNANTTREHWSTTAHPKGNISIVAAHRDSGISGRTLSPTVSAPKAHQSTNATLNKTAGVAHTNVTHHGRSEPEQTPKAKTVGISGRTFQLPVVTTTNSKISNSTKETNHKNVIFSAKQSKNFSEIATSTEPKVKSLVFEVNVERPMDNDTLHYENQSRPDVLTQTKSALLPTNGSSLPTVGPKRSFLHEVKEAAKLLNVSHCPDLESIVSGSNGARDEIKDSDSVGEDLSVVIHAAEKSLKSANNCMHRMISELKIAAKIHNKHRQEKKEEKKERHLKHYLNHTNNDTLASKLKITAMETAKLTLPINILTG